MKTRDKKKTTRKNAVNLFFSLTRVEKQPGVGSLQASEAADVGDAYSAIKVSSQQCRAEP